MFSLVTHCTKQKRPHADVFRGRACTTNFHMLHFLSCYIRARENDLETKTPETCDKITHCKEIWKHEEEPDMANSVTKTSPEQLETEFCHAISTTFLRTLGADDRTPNKCCTTTDQNNANHQWSNHLVSNSTNTSTETSHASPPTRTYKSYIEAFEVMDMRASDLHPKRQETKRAINVRMFI